MGRNTDKRVPSLHICPHCGSGLVQPTCWEQVSERTRWRVWRRCPECEWTTDGIHSEVELLDDGAHTLADELRAMEYTNMSAMTEVFLVALRNDLIGPDDFA